MRTECAAAPLLLSASYRTVAHRWVPPQWAPVLALIGGLACYVAAFRLRMMLFVAPFLLAFAVNHVGEAWSLLRKVLELKPLRQLGILSYSIYLWQQPFYKYGHVFPFHLAIVLAIVAGCISFFVVENPTRKWLNARWGNRQAGRVAGEASVAAS